MYCTKRCGTIASHQRESYRIYQAAYYQEHKDTRPPRPGKKSKLTPEERQEYRRIYQREYKRKQRALMKQGGKDHG